MTDRGPWRVTDPAGGPRVRDAAGTTFDAADVARIFAQNELILDTGTFPKIPVRYANRQYDGLHAMHLSVPVWDPAMSDAGLRRQRDAIRNALLLPLCAEYLTLLRQLLALAEQAARLRWLRHQAAVRSASDWETANLVAEVSAVCGEGKKIGRHWVFHCCFHNDQHPSLHVDPVKKTWLCRSGVCAKGGGVTDWRKLTGD